MLLGHRLVCMCKNNSHQCELNMSPADYAWDSYEKLKELYHERENTLEGIAELKDVSTTTVHRKMWQVGVATNGPGRRVKNPTYRTNKDGVEEVSGSHESVPVHRLIMVAEHGYDSVVHRDVHHKNNITIDNRPSNLELITPSQHTTLHNRQSVDDGQVKLTNFTEA